MPERGTPVVAIAAEGALPEAVLAAVLEHTPPEIAILLAGPGGGPAPERATRVEGGRAALADAAAPGDLVLLDGRHLVAAGWLDGLREAAHADPSIATASALTTAGGPTGPPDRHPRPLDEATALRLAEAVRRHPLGQHLPLEHPAGACVYVRREALELAGPLDDGFALRCSRHALVHVVADAVLVHPVEPEAGPPAPVDTTEEWAARLAARAPLTRALARARSEVEGLSVTVDGRALTDTMAGTQVHTLELIAALHRTGAVRLRVVVPPDLGATARELLASLAGVELLDATDVGPDTARTAVVHRPYQVSAPVDLLVLRLLGERIVVTQQDLLNHHNPAYHRDREGWQAHRRLTRESLAVADAVVTFSEHVASGLAAEELAPPDRRRVVPIGVDHTLPALAAEPRAPADAGAIAERPFLLCLGSDLHHKNRVFALELLEALRERHDWDGVLVLAGPHARWGSSREDEQAFLAERPALAQAVVTLPEVDEAGKAWLYAHAAAVLYPTTSEGFGLIPFEAATAGTPCLFAAGTALAELLPAELALLVHWDAGRSAEQVLPLLGDGEAAEAWVKRAREIAAGLTWDRTAAALLELYGDVIGSAPREQAALAWTAMAAEDRRGHFEGLYWQLNDEIGPTGHSLVGKERLLDEDAQRAIAALARRPATRGPFLALLRLVHRLGGRSPG